MKRQCVTAAAGCAIVKQKDLPADRQPRLNWTRATIKWLSSRNLCQAKGRDSMDGGTRTGSVELWIGVAVVALLALGCLLILRPFISAGLWAALLCFTTWPLFCKLEVIVGGRRSLAALIATLTLAAIIVAPVAILGTTLARNVSDLVTAAQKMFRDGPPEPPAWLASIPQVGDHLSNYWKLLTHDTSARLEELAKFLPAAKEIVLASGRALGEGLFQISLSLLIAFFFYRDGEAMARGLHSAIGRIGGERGMQLLDVAGATVRAVVYGVLGTALVQGVLAAIGFFVAGVPGAELLGFITFFVAVLPGGPLLVALPAALWLFQQGSTGWTIFMIAWGVMVGSIDNVIRPLLMRRGGTTPLILVMLGVLGGGMAFGLIGLFLGPTLLAVGFSLLEDQQKWVEG
jgi:predicted PurR-regulated permease PerM